MYNILQVKSKIVFGFYPINLLPKNCFIKQCFFSKTKPRARPFANPRFCYSILPSFSDKRLFCEKFFRHYFSYLITFNAILEITFSIIIRKIQKK